MIFNRIFYSKNIVMSDSFDDLSIDMGQKEVLLPVSGPHRSGQWIQYKKQFFICIPITLLRHVGRAIQKDRNIIIVWLRLLSMQDTSKQLKLRASPNFHLLLARYLISGANAVLGNPLHLNFFYCRYTGEFWFWVTSSVGVLGHCSVYR